MADDETTPFRPDGKIFASNAKTGEVEDFPDIERGWGISLERTAGIPPMEWFNDITKRADLNLQYQKNTGQLQKFDQDYCDFIGGYPKGAVLLADDGLSAYQSLADNNKDNFNDDPSSIGTSWMLWAGNGTGGGIRFGSAGGTVDAITASFDGLDELTDGMLVSFRATGENTSTAPSFNPNDLGASLIVKGTNLPLAAGDIGGEGYLVLLQYSATWNKWVLQNPATGINIGIPSTMPVGAIYVQFAGQTDPTTLFGGTWENVSSTYAGLFFRAEGGAAAEFGSSQTDGAPNIWGSVSFGVYNDSAGASPHNPLGAFGIGAEELTWLSQGENQRLAPTYFDFYASRADSRYQLSEVRPVNTTIRIWKRTA